MKRGGNWGLAEIYPPHPVGHPSQEGNLRELTTNHSLLDPIDMSGK